MADRQSTAARMVAETGRRCRRCMETALGTGLILSPTRSPISRIRAAADRRQRLGLAHPRIDANYRSTISRPRRYHGEARIDDGRLLAAHARPAGLVVGSERLRDARDRLLAEGLGRAAALFRGLAHRCRAPRPGSRPRRARPEQAR